MKRRVWSTGEFCPLPMLVCRMDSSLYQCTPDKIRDACIATSLGPRWTLTGSFVSGVMGSGGGREGFTHMLKHSGPAEREWLKDMQARQYEFTPANVANHEKSIQQDLESTILRL